LTGEKKLECRPDELSRTTELGEGGDPCKRGAAWAGGGGGRVFSGEFCWPKKKLVPRGKQKLGSGDETSKWEDHDISKKGEKGFLEKKKKIGPRIEWLG